MPSCPRPSLRIARRSLHATVRRRESAQDALAAMEASGRVEVLPFSISREEVQAQAEALGMTASFFSHYASQSKSAWGLRFNLLKGLLLRLLGQVVKPVMTVHSIKPIYVPIFAFHGCASFSCRIDVKQKTNWTVPGFSWSPLDLLRVGLTQEQFTQLEPLDLKKHTSQLQEDTITILPFTRDPTSLPSVLAAAADKHRVLSFASARPSQKFVTRDLNRDNEEEEGAENENADADVCHADEAGLLERALEKREDMMRTTRALITTAKKKKSKIGIQVMLEVDESTVVDPTVALEPETIKPFMAAYPVLVPLWLVRMDMVQSAEEEGERLKPKTIVLEGAKPAIMSQWTTCEVHDRARWLPQAAPPPWLLVTSEEEGNFADSMQEHPEELMRGPRRMAAIDIGGSSTLRATVESSDSSEDSEPGDLERHIAHDILDANAARAAVEAGNYLRPAPVSAWIDHKAVQRFSASGLGNEEFLDSIEHGSVLSEMEPLHTLIEVEKR